jgi:hypothetical protein
MSLGEIAYEAYHAALIAYRRTHHDQFDPSGRWASLAPSFKPRGKLPVKRGRTRSQSATRITRRRHYSPSGDASLVQLNP